METLHPTMSAELLNEVKEVTQEEVPKRLLKRLSSKKTSIEMEPILTDLERLEMEKLDQEEEEKRERAIQMVAAERKLKRTPSVYEKDTEELFFVSPPQDEEDRPDDFEQLIFSKNLNPQTLRVKNLSYEVTVTPNIIERLHTKKLFPKKETKQILKNVSFTARAGHFVAILGSSGSGKTTLLDNLACRARNGKRHGDILLNGQAVTQKKIKSIGAYVTQDDHFIPYLTVRESTMFVANMVFPSSVSYAQKVQRLETVLTELGLMHVADSVIGGEKVKGISGGEKRRVSIACQLLLDPSIIFLDEPTSGLDSFTAAYIIETLVSLAKSNRTVIATIHSPSDALFQRFDQIILLTQGEIVYFGQSKIMVPYFAGLGYECPSYTNPCDYFMDITSVDYRTEDTIEKSKERARFLIDQFNSHTGTLQPLTRQISAPSDGPNNFPEGIGFFAQFWYLYLRANRIILLNYWELLWDLFLAGFMGIIVGVTFWNLGHSQFSIFDRLGFIAQCAGFYPYVSILAFVAKFHHARYDFYSNRQDGLFSVLPYLCAKIFSELPFDFLCTLILSIPLYFLPGLKHEGHAYGVFLGILFLLNYSTRVLGLALSALFPMLKFANFMANLVYVLLILLTGGLLIPLDSVTPWFGWVTEISLSRFAMQAWVRNEFIGLVFECPEGAVGCIMTGEEAILELGYGDRPIRNSVVCLTSAIILFTLLQYFALRFVPQKGF